MMKQCSILLVFTLWLTMGCSSTQPVALPVEHDVVSQCYHPFFAAAEKGEAKEMLAVLSESTINHFEKTVFTDPKAPVLNWDDFTLAYRSMHISRFVSEVIVDGKRAVVKDPVGGTLKCVLEKEKWKVDLRPR